MELLNAEPRKYPTELATNITTDKLSVERITPNPAARTEHIRIDPASEPTHSPMTPLKRKYALTQAAAYAKKAKPKSK